MKYLKENFFSLLALTGSIALWAAIFFITDSPEAKEFMATPLKEATIGHTILVLTLGFSWVVYAVSHSISTAADRICRKIEVRQ